MINDQPVPYGLYGKMSFIYWAGKLTFIWRAPENTTSFVLTNCGENLTYFRGCRIAQSFSDRPGRLGLLQMATYDSGFSVTQHRSAHFMT